MANSVASRRSPSPPSKKRFGSEVPRIFTKPLRELTPETSLGFSVIEFAETVLELDLLPWQRWLLIHMLELLPDNSLRFRTVIVLVARQNGKSTLSQIVALWFMFVYHVALVIGTAQDLDVAEEIWAGAVELAEESEDLSPLIERVVKVNGKKALEVDLNDDGRTDTRYKVKAANRRAGRGLSGDVILLDELREHQSWDAWGAITKTTMARAMALILALSNAGDATSVVLRYLRQMCLRELVEAGEIDLRPELDTEIDKAITDYAAEGIDEAEMFANDDDSVAIFEWSAPPGCDVRDRDGWAMANPSLGYTITERTLASACRTDPEWVFRTECLCQWSDGTLEGPFPPGAWEASGDESSKRADGADLALCVATSWERTTTHVGLASWRADGHAHVEVIASRAGTDWLIPWLTSDERQQAVRSAKVAVQLRGAPESSLIEDMREAGVDVVDWAGPDIPNATGIFYDRVRAALAEKAAASGAAVPDDARGPQLRHRNQPVLNLAAATAVPKLTESGAFMWDRRKSPTDAAPLHAATGAVWLLTRSPETPEPPPQVHAWPTELMEA